MFEYMVRMEILAAENTNNLGNYKDKDILLNFIIGNVKIFHRPYNTAWSVEIPEGKLKLKGAHYCSPLFFTSSCTCLYMKRPIYIVITVVTTTISIPATTASSTYMASSSRGFLGCFRCSCFISTY